MNLEHAAVEAGLDRFGVDAVWQSQRTREGAVGPLDAVEAFLALLVLAIALTRDREDIVLELDVDVFLG